MKRPSAGERARTPSTAPQDRPVDDGDHANETVIVLGVADLRGAARALTRAGGRFMAVAEDGRELTPGQSESVAGDLYTPNCVSDVRLAGWTLALYSV